ncbi:MAG: CDP-alcohol phosphatidyltransferase family protein [Candidatus Hodarchaeales archaeon]
MKCVILADEEGGCLNSRGEIKPLIPLMGVPLIERAILTAKKIGLNNFYVVIGHQNARVRMHLELFAKKRGINITILLNDEWKKGNGLSVLKTKNYIDENFILLMYDHICDATILKRLKNEKIKEGEVILVVDFGIGTNNNVGSVDATRVLVEENNSNNNVIDIGQKIPSFNAFDTGIFLCSPTIFRALEESVRKGDCSLSGGIKVMTKNGTARTIDIKGAYWVNVNDEKTWKTAEKSICATMRKDSDGPIFRFVNRPISTRITRYFFLRTNFRPNHISFFAFLLATLGACFFLLGDYTNLVFGAFLAQTSSIFDLIDGEIARIKLQETVYGAWFDAVLDRYSDAFLLFGLTIYVSVHLTQINVLFILLTGFFALIGSFMISYTAMTFENENKL